MQDRYAGDVGDFGKLGILRCMEKAGVNLGINWYLVKEENHNDDGKHIEYLEDEQYRGCDDELLDLLKTMVNQNTRSVKCIEQLEILKTEKYFGKYIPLLKDNKGEKRNEWHQNAIEHMDGCDLVFLDPDNGLIPKSVGLGNEKSIKYVLSKEILDYYKAGYSVMFYNHRTREPLDVYLERFFELFGAEETRDAIIKGISFRRVAVRDYFFIIHKEHSQKILYGIENMVTGEWGKHFSVIQIPNLKVVSNALSDFAIRVKELVSRLIDTTTKLLENGEIKTIFKGLVGLQNIIELGKHNWVVILPGIDGRICEKNQIEIDEYFVDYLEREQGVYETIKENILASRLLVEKKRLVEQIFKAIEMESFALAGVALSGIIEYILALDVGFDRFKIEKMISDFKNNIGKISLDEDGLFPAFGLDGFLSNFSEETKGFGKEKEPNFVNRHWVAHGRMHRDLTKVDVYQMLCAIYALDSVIEAEQRMNKREVEIE